MLSMQRVEEYQHCLWYFGSGRLVDETVFQSCPSSPSLTSDHLLQFPLMVKQTRMAGLERRVSSHLVLHNKSVGKFSRQSQCQ